MRTTVKIHPMLGVTNLLVFLSGPQAGYGLFHSCAETASLIKENIRRWVEYVDYGMNIASVIAFSVLV